MDTIFIVLWCIYEYNYFDHAVVLQVRTLYFVVLR